MVVLALVLPALVVTGLLARRDTPGMVEPDPWRAGAGPAPDGELRRIVSWEGGTLMATFAAAQADSAPQVRIEMIDEPQRPELLVYWVSGVTGSPPTLPDGARLLGALAGRRPVTLKLPADPDGSRGRLIVYSPTQNEIVTSVDASPGDGGAP